MRTFMIVLGLVVAVAVLIWERPARAYVENSVTPAQAIHALDQGRLQVRMWNGKWRTVRRTGPTTYWPADCFHVDYSCGRNCRSWLTCSAFRNETYNLDTDVYRIRGVK